MQIENVDHALAAYLDQMAKYPEAAQRNAVAATGFSRAGLGTVNLATSDFRALLDQFERLGGGVSEKGLADAELTVDAMTDLKVTLNAVAGAIGETLLPMVTSLLTNLQEWTLANKELVVENVTTALLATAKAIKSFSEGVVEAMPTVLKIVDAIGGFKTVAVGAAAVMAGPLLSAVVTLGVALAATPFGAFLLVLGGVIAGAKPIIDNWEPVKAFFADLWDSFKWISSIPGISSMFGGGGESGADFSGFDPQRLAALNFGGGGESGADFSGFDPRRLAAASGQSGAAGAAGTVRVVVEDGRVRTSTDAGATGIDLEELGVAMAGTF